MSQTAESRSCGGSGLISTEQRHDALLHREIDDMTTTTEHGDLQDVPTFEYVIVTSTERDHKGELVPKGKGYGYADAKLIKNIDPRLLRLTEGTIERFTHSADDLTGFMEALHDQPNRKILLNALPPPSATFLTTKSIKLKHALDDRYVPKSQECMRYPKGPHHFYFDNDWETYYGEPLSDEAFVEAIRTHCPEFSNVTLGVAVSAGAYIFAPDGTLLRGATGKRIRGIADDGAPIPRIIHSVAIRMALAGYRYLKQQTNRLDPKTIIDSVTGSSDRCDFIGAPHLTGGAYQRKPDPIIFEGSQHMLVAADVPVVPMTFSEFTHKDDEYRRMLGKPQAKAKAQELLDDWAERTAKKTKRTPAELKKQFSERAWDGDQPFDFDNGETFSLNDLFIMDVVDDYVDEYHASPHELERGTQLCKLRKRGLDDFYSYDFHTGMETPIRHDHSAADRLLESNPLPDNALPDNVVTLHPGRVDGRSVEELMPLLSQRFTPLAIDLAATEGDMTAIARQLITTAQLTPNEAVRVLDASSIGSTGNARAVVSEIMKEPVIEGELGKPAKPPTAPVKLVPQTLGDIMRKPHKDPQWIVEGLIPEGTTLFAGRPKKGKSWAMFDLAIGVARGGTFLGKQCTQGDVLYMALEDPERRLKKRAGLMLLMDDDPVIEHITTFTMDDKLPVFGAGLETALVELLKSKPYRLIIIDTLKKVRPVETGRKGAYDADYDAVQHIQSITSGIEGLGIVVVHHTRKAEAVDPFDTLSGSTGLTGGSDTNIVLYWDNERQCIVLTGQGRDVEDFELAVRFDKADHRWTVTGTPDEVGLSETRRKILKVLEDGKPKQPKEIAALTGLTGEVVRKRLGEMVKDQQVVKDGDGRYSTTAIVSEPLPEAEHDAIQNS
jgi:hypothetical protein